MSGDITDNGGDVPLSAMVNVTDFIVIVACGRWKVSRSQASESKTDSDSRSMFSGFL